MSSSSYSIGKRGCKVRVLGPKNLYKSAVASASAQQFLQSCERGRARKAGQGA